MFSDHNKNNKNNTEHRLKENELFNQMLQENGLIVYDNEEPTIQMNKNKTKLSETQS